MLVVRRWLITTIGLPTLKYTFSGGYAKNPSLDLNILVRSLGEQGAALRRAIESSKQNPVPEGARPIPDRPGMYEWLVAGYFLYYEIDRSNPSETVIRVISAESN
jgi:hypothetical protein